MGRLYREYAAAEWATRYLLWMAMVGVVLVLGTQLSSKQQQTAILRKSGVAYKRIAKAIREIERKTFHVAGVLIPLVYQVMTTVYRWSEWSCAMVAATVTAAVWVAEIARLYSPRVKAVFLASPFGRIMREHEQDRLTGTAFFSLGCTLAIALFPRDLATVSILYLVLGDMTAALIGVSFGGDTVVVKLGRAGKKSVEGSLGMFVVCFCVGYSFFFNVHLCEYVAFVSAAAATLTELWSEDYLNLNDNITIPLVSCVAMTWAFRQLAIGGCDHTPMGT